MKMISYNEIKKGRSPIEESEISKFTDIIELLKPKLASISLTPKSPKLQIQIMSDIHLEFSANIDIEPKAKYLALLGDIGLASTSVYKEFLLKQAEKFEKVFVIAGNHEYYHGTVADTKNAISSICKEHKNLIFMDAKSISINGVRVIGCTLWTNIPTQHKEEISMCLRDYSRIYWKNDNPNSENTDKNSKKPITVDDTNSWHKEQVAFIKSEINSAKEANERVCVLTHHAPLKFCDAGEHYKQPSSFAFSTDLEYLFGDPVSVWAYGHTHHYIDLDLNGTRIITNPRGYVPTEARSKDFDGTLVVDVY